MRLGSHLLSNGTLQPGSLAPCRQHLAEQQLLEQVQRLLDNVPKEFRPAHLTLHYAPQMPENQPRLAPVEAHKTSDSLLVARQPRHISKSVWLHELSHLALRGPRPQTLVAQRVIQAVEEAFSDLGATLLLDNSVLGGAGLPSRDLNRSTPFEASFEQLALPGQFDPHPLGFSLARRLWSNRSALRAVGLTKCLSEAEQLRRARTIVQALNAVVQACPPSLKRPVYQALSLWVPEGLFVTPPN